jgi:hypothetical protein
MRVMGQSCGLQDGVLLLGIANNRARLVALPTTMTTAVALLIFAGAAWGIAAIVRRLLRRGIQITYLVPHVAGARRPHASGSPDAVAAGGRGHGVFIGAVATSLPGRPVAGVLAAAMMIFLVRRFRRMERRLIATSRHRDSSNS